MIDNIFGIPVFRARMPNHEEIYEAFLPLVEDKENYDFTDFWDCDAGSTMYNDEKNQRFPWELFYKGVQPVLAAYLDGIGFKKSANELYGFAWTNRYTKGQHQEIHSHADDKNLFSCAYMLKLPENSGQFAFYNTSMAQFPVESLRYFDPYVISAYGKRATPVLNEGDIIFFPSTLDHYVTYHKSDEIRGTISANFGVIDQANQQS